MRDQYDALVIGSGFGGAVAACRLAQAGRRVGVLERGRRYTLGTFPRDWSDPLNGWLFQHDQGLFDVRPVNEMTIVQGAAYGGGSHIYANVHLRMPADGFAQGWPRGYDRASLDPYYDLVAWMLDVNTVSADQPHGVPLKTVRTRQAAERMGRGDQVVLTPLAVDFGDPNTLHTNKFGAQQYGCRHVGECDIGCNYQAKNTLDLNYLTVAERHGAEVGTRCEVTRITPTQDGAYQVLYTDHGEGGAERRITAPVVVLAAGAVNSTELLLRCRDQHGTMPRLSAALGRRYSGNGDYLGFAFGTDLPMEPSSGPTITSGIVHDRGRGAARRWFIFQEGGFPREIAGLLQLLGEHDERLIGLHRAQDEVLEGIRKAARERIGTDEKDGEHSAVFLAMGRDTADGRISLVPVTHDLRVTWNLSRNLGLYETEERFCKDMAEALGGKAAANPLWRALRLPVSVHNLGGCVMADDPSQGVVDAGGEAFGYPNLFVLDGGCLPASTGVNPAHTIAAVAERNVERLIRRITGQPRWTAPERQHAVPVADPLAAVRVPAGGTPAPSAPGTGLRFTETMHGRLTAPGDAAPRPEAETSFRVTVTAPVLADFLDDATHPMAAHGTVQVPGITGRDGAQVAGGVVNLLTAGDNRDARKMIYTLPFFGQDGRPYLLDGVKDVRDHGRFDIWGSTTTLHTRVRRGSTPDGPVLLSGDLRLGAVDFARQLTTVRITATSNPLWQAGALARFGLFFAGSLWDVFVRPRLPAPLSLPSAGRGDVRGDVR
ncbi:GMC family oxidoreductase [Streptomyces ipomoeae]|uniref:Cholesterol oxidase n=2 Tax=Streptomyces ipomoeae TaxID=103232 RepID=L1L478_9ACTN|nr:GMC family oxidoreductase [Streptomyces ipomoeae]EKX67841.1 FAD dependent oxidoreductase [Streptomyces ipomoeae 91-03]MDX2696273.1 GMC family oxidoreductase [Streptomyces ipomoeae]MDX2825672.1 GMC family oxidoreductase [Streptomyces ipomoeae]MDX2844028.1 GMC family oxidoreductase [Streptomyces ipomoeae]MDX2878291.1 GMC family oxidoreductase [Streptomyces ipomoeae]